MHAVNMNVAESSGKSAGIYAVKEKPFSTDVWLRRSVENHNEERQVRVKKKKTLDLNFVGLVTMRKISGCDRCE